MTSWSWLALIGLGAFHGINPAMGWLFAVALGLYRRSRAVVVISLIPIAIGHAVAVAAVALAFWSLGAVADASAIRVTAGVALVAWAAYHWRYGTRHRARVGMQVGMIGLGAWSFLMAAGHGAGLMLLPVLASSPGYAGHMAVGHAGHHPASPGGLGLAMAAVGVHTLATLIVTAVVALVVYEWVGLAFLRRGWINLDWLWTAALAASGVLLLLTWTR